MQTRRKKYSLVSRPGGVPSPFGTNPITVSPFRNTPGPLLNIPITSFNGGIVSDDKVGTVSVFDGTTRGLMSEIDMVVGHDPGTSNSQLQTESRQQKSSVVAMYQDAQTSGEKIEMRLLMLEESERSHLMHKLVTAFQQKVILCFDHYKPELTLSCLRIVTSLSAFKPRSRSQNPSAYNQDNEQKSNRPADPFAELDFEEALKRELPNFTVSRLRGTVQQLLRRATLRQDGTLYFAGSPEESMATKSVQYFIWFFDFMDYLHELFMTFVEKIFTPLFKYFQDHNFLSSYGRTNSVSSAFSKLSQFSESDNHGSPVEDQDGSESGSLADMKRMRTQARASLLQLSKEYKDIKSIYDTTEIDKVAQRLSFVKEQLEFLLDEEDEVDPDLYSAESGKMVDHMNMDFGTENLIRLVPDIMVKLKKAGWLARRWLELDDQRTKDVSVKLEKLQNIEKQLVKRLDILRDDIMKSEKKLDYDTNELNRLMEKEGRPDTLTLQCYNVENDIERIKLQLDTLSTERDTFASKLKDIVQAKDLKEFHRLKFRFEANKLKRFITERKLATLNYQKNLLTDDLSIELFVRPSVIHSSNKLQDECERLEKLIREQKEELVSIKHALMPVQEDKVLLINRLSRQRHFQAPWKADGSPSQADKLQRASGHALYVRSLHGARNSNQPPQPSFPVIQQLPANRPVRTVSPPSW